MPSVESIVMTSIKRRLQKSPLLSRDKGFLDSIKVSFFGGVLKVEYQDDDGNIVSVKSESSDEETSDSSSESSEKSETTETVTKTQAQINTLITTKKQVIEDALEDAVPKILEKLLFS